MGPLNGAKLVGVLHEVQTGSKAGGKISHRIQFTFETSTSSKKSVKNSQPRPEELLFPERLRKGPVRGTE